MPRIDDLLTDTRSRYADWMEERLADLPGWDEMSDQEHVFLLAYACTGEKAEALRFINRHATWCHDRRFRSKAFIDVVTPEPNEHIDYITATRARMLIEATTTATLRSVLVLSAILDAEPSRRTGITLSTQLRAIKQVHKAVGLTR